ncbi:MAG: DUF255 domain-containing protein [Cyclobacteriaceae bacterium]|nr:DUF255 domain-containing protein [Cyclobacteriaceae bacterium]
MKKIQYLLIVFVLNVSFSFTPKKTGENPESETQVQWYSIEQVQELVKNEPRKVFIDVYTDWCGWCKVMDKNTFTDPDIIKKLNSDFYAVKLDGEGKDDIVFKEHTFKFVAQGRKGYHELAAALMNGKMSYPTTVYLDEELQPITMVPGYLKPEQMGPILDFFGKNHYKSQTWEEYNARK